MPVDDGSFWERLRARFSVSRAWLARGVGLLVTVALVAGFAALVWRDRASGCANSSIRYTYGDLRLSRDVRARSDKYAGV